MAQVADIFLGKTTNWKDVGGKDAPITLYSRENSSGTYEFFKEHVLSKKDFSANAQNVKAEMQAAFRADEAVGVKVTLSNKRVKLSDRLAARGSVEVEQRLAKLSWKIKFEFH